MQSMSGSTSASAAAAAPVQVAVITTLGCPYCKKIKAALQVRTRSWGGAAVYSAVPVVQAMWHWMEATPLRHRLSSPPAFVA